MKNTYEYFVIKDIKNNYGLMGTYKTPEEALAYINESYRNALAEGYDNRHNRWIIVQVTYTKEHDKFGNFISESTIKTVFAHVQHSHSDDAFVVCY